MGRNQKNAGKPNGIAVVKKVLEKMPTKFQDYLLVIEKIHRNLVKNS